MKEFYTNVNLKDPIDVIATGLATVVVSPLVLLGSLSDTINRAIQGGENMAKATEIKDMQYKYAFYILIENLF